MKIFFYLFCLISTIALHTHLVSQSDDNLHRYMWANYKQFGGHKEQAAQWYNQIFSSRNPSIHTNKGYVIFLFENGNHQKIVEIMPKIDETFSRDPDMQIIFVSALRKVGRTQEADDKLMRLSHEYKTHSEVVFQAAETYIKRKELQNALSLINDYLNIATRRANNFVFHFLKSQIYTQLNDYPQALTSIKQCLKAHPRFPQGWLLLALIEEQSGKLNEAIDGYTSYLEIAGSNKQIEHHLLELAFKQKATMDRNKQVVLINKTCLEKCMILFDRKQYSGALTQLDICLSQNPTDAQLRLLKIQILSAIKDYNAVIELLVTWSTRETENHIWLQVLHLLPRVTKNIPQAITAFEKIHGAHPQQILPTLYLADLHTRSSDGNKSLSYHEKSLALTSDPALKARILFQIAIIHYQERHFTDMLDVLTKATQQRTVYPPALNLLAYYYATEKQEYAKASALVEKALETDPENPHFLDTKALVLYKQKKYGDALTILETLEKKIPTDSTMLIHLAKTHHKLGNTTKALETASLAQKHAHNPYEKNTTSLLISQWKQ